MTELHEAALEYAAMGWAVFPVLPGLKKPACENGFKDATTDMATINAWWAEMPDANIGFVPESAGLCVIDVDPGADVSIWEALPPTYTVKTPRGHHLYFTGSLPPSAGALGPNVDTRGVGSYVLLSPSRTADGQYEEEGGDLAVLPTWVRAALAKPVAQVIDEGTDEPLDEPSAILRGEAFLEHQPILVDGRGSDEATFRYAAQLRDYGISAEQCVNMLMMASGFDRDWLEEKVANAYRYGQNAPGAWAIPSAADTFKLLPAPPPAPLPWLSLTDILTGDVAPVVELIPGLVEKGIATFLCGPGGVHKSRLALQWGLCLATGTAVFGRAVEQCAFVFLSYEDHIDEVKRRARKMVEHFELPPCTAIHILDLTIGGQPIVAAQDGDEGAQPTDFYDRLRAGLLAIPGHKFVAMDSAYNGMYLPGQAKINEGAVKSTIEFLGRVCRETDSTMLVLWHPSSAGMARGDMSGHSVAWHNTPRARLSLTAQAVKDKETGDYILKVEKRNNAKRGGPMILHYDSGVLSYLLDEDATVVDARILEVVLSLVVAKANQGSPIKREGRSLSRDGTAWLTGSLKSEFGDVPFDRLRKILDGAASDTGPLRYTAGHSHTKAGYYPRSEDAI